MVDRIDPYRTYNFAIDLIELGGIVAGFSEASGLSFEIDTVEYREGTDPMYVRKLPALRKYPNITLKRGMTQNRVLYQWYFEALSQSPTRREGAVVLRDEGDNDVLRWEFTGAWLCKWEGPSMNASGNEVAIESVELCVESIQLVQAR